MVMCPHLQYKLNDYTLCANGHVIVDSVDAVTKLMSSGTDLSKIHIDKLTDDIIQYNRIVPKSERITEYEDIQTDVFDLSWNIPEYYKTLDVKSFIMNKLQQHLIEMPFTEDDQYKRITRTLCEYDLYERYKVIDILRVIIYIINTLEQHNVVWGVGRGSSVSSYILYLIGAHDVDSVKYELDIKDFITTVEK